MKRTRLQEAWRARRTDVAYIAVIAAFFLCFFSWVLFRGRVLVGGDAFLYSYPLRTAAWAAIRGGTLPLWTPTLFSGYPLLSMAQLGLGYPLTWGYALLPGWYAEEIYVLSPFLLAPAFTYAYARTVGRSPVAALLAGLTFGYGGLLVSPLATTAMHSNTVTWLPLVLLAVERSRRGRFAYCLVGATAAYALSVLAGHAHSFLYVGLIANLYGLFLSLFDGEQADNAVMNSSRRQRWQSWQRWRPLAAGLGATLLGAGVAAFQLRETLRAVRLSARTQLDYDYYLHSAYTLRAALSALVAPLYADKSVDVTPYVPPLALALAAFGVASALRRPRRDPRVFLWAALALLGWLLMLGGSTPLARVLYHVPLVNLFRFPARHTFEWTFAVAILAAYGWDAATRVVAGRLARERWRTRGLMLGLICLALAALVGWLWWRATGEPQGPGLPAWYAGRLSVAAYLLWKSCFVALTAAALCLCCLAAPARGRACVLTAAVALLCFVEPFIAGWQWWHLFTKSPARFTTPAATTRYLLAQTGERGRVYVRVHLDVEEFTSQPRVDGPDLPTLYGLENVGGYEPLILARYARALRNVWLDDDIYRRAGEAPDLNLLSLRSHVLDLLNTRFLVSYEHMAEVPQDTIVKGDLRFAPTALGSVAPGQTLTLATTRGAGDTLALVTALSHSTHLADGEPVARLRVQAERGRIIERELRAGTDTAEWAHERADVRATVKHKLAPVFDARPGDATNSFSAHRYLALVPLGEKLRPARVEINNISAGATLDVSYATLYDTASRQSSTLADSSTSAELDPESWRVEYDRDGALVLRNLRALPRAWLVAEAVAVDGEEALRRIRGEGEAFDPRRTALLEVRADELPALPGGVTEAAMARIVEYESNRLVIETDAATSTVLVVSEIFYPGWEATVDGRPVRIDPADYLLRGVALPAGQHRVEMRYAAPAARGGVIISAFTLLLLAALLVYTRRAKAMTEKRGL